MATPGEETHMKELDCSRCGAHFPLDAHHTEIVRRDFVEEPEPTKVEHLCPDCWRVYVEEFMGQQWPASGAAPQ